MQQVGPEIQLLRSSRRWSSSSCRQLAVFWRANFLDLYFYLFFISGDRIISVNGESVSGKSYAEVVILIQRLRDNLSLIVVPKQDDILQMVKLLLKKKS